MKNFLDQITRTISVTWKRGKSGKIIMIFMLMLMSCCFCSVPAAIFSPNATETPELMPERMETVSETTKVSSDISTQTVSAELRTSTITPTLIITSLPPTATPVPPTDSPIPPTATPAPPTTNKTANLRTGPGTIYPKSSSVQAGAPLDIVGQTADGAWYKLGSGAWIAAFLVKNVSANLPTVTDIPTPPPTVTPTSKSARLTIDIHGSKPDEYVIVTNIGNTPGNLSGWRIQSYGEKSCVPIPDQVYFFPDITLNPNESVRIHSGPKAINQPPNDLFWTSDYIWNNKADRGDLINNAGQVVAKDAWGRCSLGAN